MKFIQQYGYLIASILFLFSGIVNLVSTNGSTFLKIIYFILAIFFFIVYYRDNKRTK